MSMLYQILQRVSTLATTTKGLISLLNEDMLYLAKQGEKEIKQEITQFTREQQTELCEHYIKQGFRVTLESNVNKMQEKILLQAKSKRKVTVPTLKQYIVISWED